MVGREEIAQWCRPSLGPAAVMGVIRYFSYGDIGRVRKSLLIALRYRTRYVLILFSYQVELRNRCQVIRKVGRVE